MGRSFGHSIVESRPLVVSCDSLTISLSNSRAMMMSWEPSRQLMHIDESSIAHELCGSSTIYLSCTCHKLCDRCRGQHGGSVHILDIGKESS